MLKKITRIIADFMSTPDDSTQNAKKPIIENHKEALGNDNSSLSGYSEKGHQSLFHMVETYIKKNNMQDRLNIKKMGAENCRCNYDRVEVLVESKNRTKARVGLYYSGAVDTFKNLHARKKEIDNAFGASGMRLDWQETTTRTKEQPDDKKVSRIEIASLYDKNDSKRRHEIL